MIELQNISKSFDGVSVLDNISTGIPDSGIFAICGASGSGKTTLMRIILGLEQPDSGNISGLEGKKTAVVFFDHMAYTIVKPACFPVLFIA